MAEIISKLGNLQALIEDAERIQEEYNVIKSDIENTRAILSAPKDYIADIYPQDALTLSGTVSATGNTGAAGTIVSGTNTGFNTIVRCY